MAQINYKLILILNSFTEKELEQFRLFISCPLFTKGRNYDSFLDYVLENKNDPDRNNKPEKIKAAGKGMKVSDQTFRNRCSELYKLGEDFLIYTGLTENRAEREKILLKKLLEKKLHGQFINNYRKFSGNVNQKAFDIPKLKTITGLNEILIDYFAVKNKVDTLYDELYDYSKLVLCLNLLELFQINFEFIQQELHNIKYDPNYVRDYLKDLEIGKTMNEFKGSDSLVFKITAMNYYLFKAYGNDKGGELYSESHKLFIGLMPDLADDYKINIFRIMINLCIMKINTGELIYRDKLFRIYNEKLEQNLTADLEYNAYTFNNFRDYVYIGITLKKYRWVENFIHKYSGNLPPGMRESETDLSYAKLDFEKKDFKRSLKNLDEVKPTHYLQYIDTSLLKLCNFYELNKFEEAYLEIDKQNHYLRNHTEIPKTQYLYNKNFMKVYKKLVKIKTDPDNNDKGIIEKELSEIKHIAKRNWLKEKIDE